MMKSQKLSIILIVLFSLSFCFGQEKPKAVLVNQLAGKTNCEFLLAMTNSFLADLSNEPDATGYAIFYLKKNAAPKYIWEEKILRRSLYDRKFDPNRLKIAYGENDESFKIEFWKVPAGAEKPVYTESGWTETALDFSKPFIYGSEDDLAICPTFIPEYYAALLKQTPNVRGKLVIFDSSKLNRLSKAREWLTLLTKDFKVPRNRLRLFFAKDKGLPNVEFWIVPVRKK